MKKAIIVVVVMAVIATVGYVVYKERQLDAAKDEACGKIETIDTKLYDGEELDTVNNYIADALTKIKGGNSQEEFDTVIDALNNQVAEVKTTEQKKKEEAERIAEEMARIEAEAEAAIKAEKKKSSGSADSKGCVGGGSDNFY